MRFWPRGRHGSPRVDHVQLNGGDHVILWTEINSSNFADGSHVISTNSIGWTGEALTSSGASPGHRDAFLTAWRASRPSSSTFDGLESLQAFRKRFRRPGEAPARQEAIPTSWSFSSSHAGSSLVPIIFGDQGGPLL
ncbi:hypothetical protein PSTG_05389 [Puccinia striiformis f. sp. tritici PST-78]|uniref:Uncharacterized protein n=1 Tax=Puccinia striiformis f. sp. tritici PST-78 TaxID=1165861 RepID=A0A0L0VQ03_9BASI|nr:hypothetical protein PSTG_05389 [Puccinia striiformis f. sp. tritici PST-78]